MQSIMYTTFEMSTKGTEDKLQTYNLFYKFSVEHREYEIVHVNSK